MMFFVGDLSQADLAHLADAVAGPLSQELVRRQALFSVPVGQSARSWE